MECDKCGKAEEVPEVPGFLPGFHVIQLSGGFGSRFPADLCTLEIVICEECLEAWVDTFKNKKVIMADSDFGFGDERYTDEPECVLDTESSLMYWLSMGCLVPKDADLQTLDYPEVKSVAGFPIRGYWGSKNGQERWILDYVAVYEREGMFILYRDLSAPGQPLRFCSLEDWEQVGPRHSLPGS